MKLVNKTLLSGAVTLLLLLSLIFSPAFPLFASEESQESPAGVGHAFFGGHEYDTDTGLSYMNARYYNGKVGRFVSEDPAYLLIGDQSFKDKYKRTLEMHLSDPQSLSSYSYVNNNPLRWTDPDGEILPLIGLVEVGVGALLMYAPQITSFAQSIINSPLAQLGFIQAVDDAKQGNYPMAIFGAATSGDLPAGKMISAFGKEGGMAGKISNLVDRIAAHGSYEKHVVRQREYGTLFENKDQWKDYVNSVITNPSASFKGPTKDLYWDGRLGTIVIDNKMGGAPTAFRPELSIERGKAYFLKEVNEQLKRMEGGAR